MIKKTTLQSNKKSKDIEVKEVKPNAGFSQLYEDALLSRIDAMNKSVMFWVKAQFNANTPVLASDATIKNGNAATALNKQINRLAKRWQRSFDIGAKRLAEWFVDKAMSRTEEQFRKNLDDVGFAVEFKFTDSARDAYNAVINENIQLIKSIPEQYLTQVQGAVMRSVSTGRDLGTLSKEIESQFGVTKRRAAFIARDQNNKATAVINRVRQQELGITTAIWKHSRGGKHPRASHIAYSGKEYDTSKGAFIDGKYIFPGEEPNCKCFSKSVIKGFID